MRAYRHGLRAGAVILALLAGMGPAGATVRITEFMASNDRTLKDDFGEDADWIELCNSGSTEVNLEGWRLTDQASDPSPWVFPARTLGPGEYLLVYATGRDRRLYGVSLHTDFKLSAGGEYLALIRPDGSIASEFAPAYPPQVTDIAYGFAQSETVAVAPPGAAAQVGVPVSQEDYDTHFADWTTRLTPMIGDPWRDAATGVGYDGNATYGAWISAGGDLTDQMRNQPRTACLRVPFEIGDPADVASLRLRMRWDDGFIAYINGVEVARDSAPNPALWNSLGTLNRTEALNESWTDFTIAAGSVPLHAGTNLLAIHGFNITVSSSDFLLLPVLDVVLAAGSATPTYLLAPTPGAPNGNGGPIGPALSDPTQTIPRPSGDASSPPAVVTVQVAGTVFPVDPATVKLCYRTLFGAESQTPLRDDGIAPDAAAGDGIYTGALPTAGPAAGQMLRWRFEAADSEGNIGRAPRYLNADDGDYYYGTVAVNTDEDSSSLPVIHQFIENPAAAATYAGTRCSIFFLNRFYDNVLISLHGQSTTGFAKKSSNLDFNSDNRFTWSETATRTAKDVDLLTNYADKTRTRNTLAHEVSRMAGGTHHFAFPVRVQRNAAFHGVMDMMEDGDGRMLERNGLDPLGAFYKIYDALLSTSSAEKKTRQEEDRSDLQTLITGLNPSTALDTRRTYAYDHVNLAATINYLATRQLIGDLDHGHKNYYLYRDTPGTGEWRPIIWDVDLSFGHRWITNYFDDNIHTNTPVRAVMASDNRLYRLIAETPEFRAMYVRRMRTLMDEILQPPGTVNGLLETRMREIVAQVDPDPANPSAWTDGDRDFTQWGTWGRGLRPREETEYVIANYFGPRRNYLYNQDDATRERFGLTAGSGDPIPHSTQINTPAMVVFHDVDAHPASGNPAEEYLILRNATAEAVDVSGWTLSGGITYTFPGGTVIPPGDGLPASDYQGLLHVVKNAAAFRERASGPTGGQRRFVQGHYAGQLSARGETVALHDPGGQLIARMSYTGTPTAHQQFLRITELQYHPANPTTAEADAMPGVNDDDFEFIELANLGPAPLDLEGARFTQGITFIFPAAALEPGARLIIARNPAAFALRYPGVSAPILGPYDGLLDNGGERLELVDPVGEVILDFEYKDGWYPVTDGGGRTMVLRDESTAHDDFGNAVSWAISGNAAGSPGVGDIAFAQAYRGWDNFHFDELERENLLISGPWADADSDGRPNWVEYARGTNPRAPDAPAPVQLEWMDAHGTRLPGVRFIRAARTLDVVYSLQATSDLASPDSWTPIATEAHHAEPIGDGSLEHVLLLDPSPSPSRRFYRLHIEYTP